jgi:hypothetical protein
MSNVIRELAVAADPELHIDPQGSEVCRKRVAECVPPHLLSFDPSPFSGWPNDLLQEF